MSFTTHEAVVALTLLTPALFLFYQCFFGALHEIPGPFLSRFSRLWYFSSVLRGKHEKEAIVLHKNYGKVVRIAPDCYSIDDPDSMKAIYGRGTRFTKAEWYKAFEEPHQPSIFSGRDIKRHERDRKRLQKYYSMSVMTSYERYVDNCIALLEQRFGEMALSGKTINLAWWLQCFAFDVIGEITYSRRFGFLDKGEDVDKLVESVQGGGRYGAFVGVFHEFHYALYAATGYLSSLGLVAPNSRAYLRNRTLKHWNERKAGSKEFEKQREGFPGDPIDVESTPKDFLTKFIEANQSDPKEFELGDAMNGVGGNIAAGSDTTSITLSAIVYHLNRNPDALSKLRAEIAEHKIAGTISEPITFKESQHLDYLQAVIKEALRINPAVGLPLLRVVPPEGATISGFHFPGGSTVGVNPWVAHNNPDVFGDDVALFRPERWLKSCNDEATLSKMEHYYIPFGSGSRSCIGRNVSMLEMSKLIPQIVSKFDFELSDDVVHNGLKSKNEFFVLPQNFFAKIHERKSSAS